VDVAVLFFDKLKVDDPVGAVAVHGVNGLFGTLAVGFFALEGGLFFGGGMALLITQIVGVVTIALFSFILTFILMKLIKSLVGIRITSEEEEAGIDSVSFGVKSYSNE
jgi:Amt family ammonium transporter